jgi:hypothetical protein
LVISISRKAKQEDILKIAPGIFRNAKAMDDLRPTLLEIRGGAVACNPLDLGEEMKFAMPSGSISVPVRKEDPGVVSTHLAIII